MDRLTSLPNIRRYPKDNRHTNMNRYWLPQIKFCFRLTRQCCDLISRLPYDPPLYKISVYRMNFNHDTLPAKRLFSHDISLIKEKTDIDEFTVAPGEQLYFVLSKTSSIYRVNKRACHYHHCKGRYEITLDASGGEFNIRSVVFFKEKMPTIRTMSSLQEHDTHQYCQA